MKGVCIACGKHGEVDLDHMKTRGSGGTDEDWNVWNLCRRDHALKHQMGLKWLSDKYPSVKKALLEKGWEYNEFLGKWARYDFTQNE